MNEISIIKDVFEKRGDFEAAIFCTFGLNLQFLENYVLKTNALSLCESVSIFTDSSTYNGFIEDKPRWLNKKYLVTRVPSRYVFHPKIYLIASTKKAILAVGSANLTREGMTSNLELLSLFEFSKEQTENSNLLRDVINYFKQLAQISGNTIARNKVDEMEVICSGFMTNGNQFSPRFIHNIQRPLLDDMQQYLGQETPTKITIISPFYDSKLQAIESLQTLYPRSEINIFLQQAKSNFPISKFESIKDNVNLYLYRNIDRYIHGKSIIFELSDKTILYMGSANCTNVALLQSVENGNYEAGILSEISNDIKSQLLQPLGIEALALHDINELTVAELDDEAYRAQDGLLSYILLAVREKDDIIITTNEQYKNIFTISELIVKNEESQITIKISPEYTNEIKISYSKQLKNIKEPFYIQGAGKDAEGNAKLTNIYWVINLEEKKDETKKRYRYLYANPFELASYLYELTRLGNIEELTKFMQTFEIPFDLILPPHLFKNKAPWASEGNVEGALSPAHLLKLTNADGIEPYKYFLDRINQKMLKHIESPQKEKISNYIYLISLMYSLINYLDMAIYKKYNNVPNISAENWSEIRQYYNLLFSYLDSSWKQTWSDNSYSGKVNYILANEIEEITGNSPVNFEQFLITSGYFDVIEELIQIATTAFDNFQSLYNSIQVDTGLYGLVKPKLWERDIHLLEAETIRDEFMVVKNKLESYKKNMEETTS